MLVQCEAAAGRLAGRDTGSGDVPVFHHASGKVVSNAVEAAFVKKGLKGTYNKAIHRTVTSAMEIILAGRQELRNEEVTVSCARAAAAGADAAHHAVVLV
jgi:hypothetical protein